MGIARRKFPRVGFERPCEVEVRVADGAGRARRVRVPMTIRSMSCEGAGLALRAPLPGALARGDGLILYFRAGTDEVTLPGQVVWYSPEAPGSFDLGVRLHLEAAGAQSRQIYAAWIVEQIQVAARRRARYL